MSDSKIKWRKEPSDKDYPAALSYLNLLFVPGEAEVLIEHLKHAPVVVFAAKDIFRASELPQLDATNSHVKKNMDKIARGDTISPVLLVRDPRRGKVIIADGYHRVCAVHQRDEDAMIPCKIV